MSRTFIGGLALLAGLSLAYADEAAPTTGGKYQNRAIEGRAANEPAAGPATNGAGLNRNGIENSNPNRADTPSRSEAKGP